MGPGKGHQHAGQRYSSEEDDGESCTVSHLNVRLGRRTEHTFHKRAK